MKDSDFEESDEILVSRSKNGDKEAFDILVQRYRQPLFRFIYHSIRQKDDAEDITQEAFVKAYLSLHQLKDDHLFKIWLFKIGLNLIRDSKRLAKRRKIASLDSLMENQEAQPESDDSSSEEGAEKQEIYQRLEKEISALPQELREVIVLRDIQGFSYEEIAFMLHCPLGTVKSRLFQARKILREKLSDILGDDVYEL
ncbi:sigma-70 family RNA polymerase sigma factor [bacterium]|nr:sigma-70 family RNA polymerase sigma factor [bacterium]